MENIHEKNWFISQNLKEQQNKHIMFLDHFFDQHHM
jgi:hypothetical protein